MTLTCCTEPLIISRHIQHVPFFSFKQTLYINSIVHQIYPSPFYLLYSVMMGGSTHNPRVGWVQISLLENRFRPAKKWQSSVPSRNTECNSPASLPLSLCLSLEHTHARRFIIIRVLRLHLRVFSPSGIHNFCLHRWCQNSFWPGRVRVVD